MKCENVHSNEICVIKLFYLLSRKWFGWMTNTQNVRNSDDNIIKFIWGTTLMNIKHFWVRKFGCYGLVVDPAVGCLFIHLVEENVSFFGKREAGIFRIFII